MPEATVRVPWFQEIIALCQKNPSLKAHEWDTIPVVWQEFYLQSYRAECRAGGFRPKPEK